MRLHSISFPITNSSTDIFLCHTSRSLKEVKEIFGLLVEGCNILSETYTNYDPFYQVNPTVSTEKLKAIVSRSKEFARGRKLITTDIAKIYIATEKDENDKYYADFRFKPRKGQILIRGVDDNIFPGKMFEMICNAFNAVSCHLG